MVGGNLGKKCVSVFVLVVVIVALEHDTALVIEPGLGNSFISRLTFCKFISWVVFESMFPRPLSCRSYVQEKSKQALYQVVHLLLSIPTMSTFPMSVLIIFILWYTLNLLLISCHWWGIHQGPPVTSLFPLTPTYYSGIKLRNHLVP